MRPGNRPVSGRLCHESVSRAGRDTECGRPATLGRAAWGCLPGCHAPGRRQRRGRTLFVPTWTDSLIDLGVPGIVGGLLGVVLGWLLTERSAGRARREEWERADQQAVNLRVRDAAEQLDDVLAEWHAMWRRIFSSAPDSKPTRPSELLEQHGRWERVWRRFEYRMPDPELEERLDAVHRFLSVVEREAANENAPSIDLTLQSELVIVTGRWALAAFLTGRSDYPAPFCPTGAE